MFRFAINDTDTIQSFFTHQLDSITAEPYQAIDTSLIHGDTLGVLKPIGSFINTMRTKRVKRFYIQRTFALGDILMLVPVIRALRRMGYDPYMRTIRWAKPILELLGIEAAVMEAQGHPPEGEYGIMLDGTVERDHAQRTLSELHRTNIYFGALGVQKVPRKLDWSMDLKRLSGIEIPVENYIVFQGRGSTSKKQLPSETIQSLIFRFEERNIPLIYIGERVGLRAKKKNTIFKWQDFPVRALFSYIAHAKALVTMDSSPLWVSHFTKTPTVVLFGPTRASERLIQHPLYPKRAIGIALNECMNPPCKSCFEAAGKCNDRIDCLKIRPQRIFDLIYPEIEKWL